MQALYKLILNSQYIYRDIEFEPCDEINIFS
jgi:hypothetical protein